jgi:hypothetical protein
MPGKHYAEIGKKLRAAGVTPDTPCAIISRASTRRQKTHRTTVSELSTAPEFPAPTLLVVGEVVRFADPALLANEFVIPSEIEGDRAAVTAALFADFPYQASGVDKSDFERFEREEEPLA